MSSFFRGLWKSNSKHKKLCEEWALANSCESMGPSTSSGSSAGPASSSASASSSRTGPADDTDSAPETIFSLKYLGSTLVESPSSELETAEAIKTVISVAKASGKKLQRVSLAVSQRGIRMTDLVTEEEQLRVSIDRISYCSADARHDHVFAFIATNLNETMECHAYLCPKRKVAQTVTLTVAQAFNAAYELWQLSQLDSQIYQAHDESLQPESSTRTTTRDLDDDEANLKTVDKSKKSTKGGKQTTKVCSPDVQKSALIDIAGKEPRVTAKVESWVPLEEGPCYSSPDEGIPLKTLRSASSPSTAVLLVPGKSTTTCTSLVAPQQPKLQNAWLMESNITCSS